MCVCVCVSSPLSLSIASNASDWVDTQGGRTVTGVLLVKMLGLLILLVWKYGYKVFNIILERATKDPLFNFYPAYFSEQLSITQKKEPIAQFMNLYEQ